MRKAHVFAIAALALATACGGMKGGNSIPQTPDRAFVSSDAGGPISILKKLKTQVTIGSTIDPVNGDLNPHGLAVDGQTLYACNFSDSSNKQGRGTTIVTLATTPGSSPQHFASNEALRGCSSLEATPRIGALYATASMSPALDKYCMIVFCGAVGRLDGSNTGRKIVRPWSVVWAAPNGYRAYDIQAMFLSDATTGSILRVAFCSPGVPVGSCRHPMTRIVTGFKVNHGKAGRLLGPSLAFSRYRCDTAGLHYRDPGTLFVVDGASNTVVAIHGVMDLRKGNSIVVGADGTTFGGPEKAWAQLIYAGKPLNGPMSAAVLDGGDHLVVGNTTEPPGTNSLIEIALPKCLGVPPPLGTVVDQVNVDKGAAGAIFGIVAAHTRKGPVVYFNDDNSNTVQALMP